MLIRCGLFTKTITPPVITSFALSNTTRASGGCSPVLVDATWAIKDPDNTSYKLVIVETGEEFACANNAASVDTGASFLDPDPPPAPPSSYTPTLTLAVVRRSDSVTLSSQSATSTNSVNVGLAC